MLILFGLVSVLLLTAATGYFVAQEFAYVAVDRNRLRQRAESGDAASARALKVTSRLSFTLSGSQLGITVTALLVGYVCEPYLGAGLAHLLGGAGVPAAASLSIAVAVALAFSTVVQMVLGELGPKNLGIARPEALARSLSRSTLVYLRLAGPLIWLFDTASNKLLRALGIEPAQELSHGATPEDLERIIDESRDYGHLSAETSRLLEGGLDFRTLTAGQVMTPRVAVRTIGADEPASAVVDLLDSGHSRFPVLGESVDDVLGVVGIAEVLTLPRAERATTTVRRIVSSPLLVPATLRLPEVLERLRSEHRQLAVVVDEFGGFAGVASFEDLAEEVVGEILDEDDPVEPQAVEQRDGVWLVPARWRVDEVAEATGITLPEGEGYDTLGGLVMDRLGRTPDPGDAVEVELAGPAGSAGSAGSAASAGSAGPDEPTAPQRARLEVATVARHVPDTITLRLLEPAR